MFWELVQTKITKMGKLLGCMPFVIGNQRPGTMWSAVSASRPGADARVRRLVSSCNASWFIAHGCYCVMNYFPCTMPENPCAMKNPDGVMYWASRAMKWRSVSRYGLAFATKRLAADQSRRGRKIKGAFASLERMVSTRFVCVRIFSEKTRCKIAPIEIIVASSAERSPEGSNPPGLSSGIFQGKRAFEQRQCNFWRGGIKNQPSPSGAVGLNQH